VGEVVELPCETLHSINPDTVLNAHVGELDKVLVLGWHKDGRFVAATSTSDLAQALWLATKFMHKCHDSSYEAEGISNG